MLEQLKEDDDLTLSNYISSIKDGEICGNKFTCSATDLKEEIINKNAKYFKNSNEFILNFEIHSNTSLFILNDSMINIYDYIPEDAEFMFFTTFNDEIKENIVSCTLLVSGKQ